MAGTGWTASKSVSITLSSNLVSASLPVSIDFHASVINSSNAYTWTVEAKDSNGSTISSTTISKIATDTITYTASGSISFSKSKAGKTISSLLFTCTYAPKNSTNNGFSSYTLACGTLS